MEHSDYKTSYVNNFCCISFQWFRNCKKLCLTNIFMFEHVIIKIGQYIVFFFIIILMPSQKVNVASSLSFRLYRFHILTLVFPWPKGFFLLIFTIFVYLNTQPNSVIIPFMVPKLSPIINWIKGLHSTASELCLPPV